MEQIAEGPRHTAMMRFRGMMQKAWNMLGHNLSPGPKLAKWLQEVGAVDVDETILVNKCGPAAEDVAQGERGTSILIALLDGIEVLAGSASSVASVLAQTISADTALIDMPGFFFSPEDFRKLRADLVQELSTVGNYWHTHVVWARKPV